MRNSTAAKKTVMGIIALIVWFALISQFYLILQTTAVTGYSKLKLTTNFFSYFTILSNLLIAVCLTILLLNPYSDIGSFFSKAAVQSAIAVYIFIVGLVYNLVLRGIVSLSGFAWVVDNMLHVAVPVLFVLYWFIFTPKKVLHWKIILPWLVFPAVYLVYSLLRGPIADWYPYPFLHIGKLGYMRVLINSLFVTFAFLTVGLLFIMLNRLTKKPAL